MKQTPGRGAEKEGAGPVTGGPVRALEGNSARHDPGEAVVRPSVPDLLLILLAAMLAAYQSPLTDADLPLHLRIGALLWQTEGWPTTEPLAWTRPGAPYFAYSWLPQMAYAWGWSGWGRPALSALHAVVLGASVWSVWDVARRDGWSVWATRLLLGVHLILWGIVQPATRPQLLLAVAIPLAWSAALQLRDGRTWQGMTVAFGAAVLAVNAHLLFPLTLAPVVILLANSDEGAVRVARRPLVLFVLSVLAGWCCTPYVFDLPAVFTLNFAPNPLFGGGAAIQEHQPGFAWFRSAPLGMQGIAFGLLALPLLPSTFRQSRGRLVWYTASWLVGLVLFALAVRGLLLWWLLALPLVAAALGSIPVPTVPRLRRAVSMAWLASLAGLVLQAVQARTSQGPLRSNAQALPHPETAALRPVMTWLQCATGQAPAATPVRGLRGTTVFNYGSLLAWSLPAISWSVDGRTIFPDSVAQPEATPGEHAGGGHVPYGSAAVVVLPAGHRSGRLLNADPRYERVVLAGADTTTAHLWVRRTFRETVERRMTASGPDACGYRAQP